MRIIEKHPVYRNGILTGWVVLRESKPGEFVTGYVHGSQEPSDATEHAWGHYFTTRDEAEEDARIRVEAMEGRS